MKMLQNTHEIMFKALRYYRTGHSIAFSTVHYFIIIVIFIPYDVM